MCRCWDPAAGHYDEQPMSSGVSAATAYEDAVKALSEWTPLDARLARENRPRASKWRVECEKMGVVRDELCRVVEGWLRIEMV
jgi:hypothetical protein